MNDASSYPYILYVWNILGVMYKLCTHIDKLDEGVTELWCIYALNYIDFCLKCCCNCNCLPTHMFTVHSILNTQMRLISFLQRISFLHQMHLMDVSFSQFVVWCKTAHRSTESHRHSPILYSQIAGNTESSIPRYLTPYSKISSYCLNSLTINQYFINSNKMQNVSRNNMSFKKWLFCSLCSFSSHYLPVPICFGALLRYMCTYDNVELYMTINRKWRENVKGLSSPGGFVINVLLLFTIKSERIGLFYLVIIR